MNHLNVVKFPEDDANNVVAGLRNLADNIEAGQFGDAHNLAWVIDKGDGAISVGLLGRSGSPGAEAHLLLALGLRNLEGARVYEPT